MASNKSLMPMLSEKGSVKLDDIIVQTDKKPSVPVWLMITIALISVFVVVVIVWYSLKENFAINKIFEEQFLNKDYIDEEDSYENKYLYEQKVFNMLNPLNKKKYLNLSQAAKDSFLTDISLSKI
jgi:hypothetical protein